MKGSIIMSFASEIKKELSIIDFESLCCTKAELAALIRMNGVSYLSKDKYTLDVQTENAAIARRMYRLIKEIYVHPVEILVRKKMKLRKNNVYIVRLLKDVPQLLQQLQIFNKKNEWISPIPKTYLNEECCRRAYLRGAFLAGGSVNNPETASYHLEIFTYDKEHSASLCQLLNTFGLRAREHKRRNGYITYIKEAEKITEFLILIEAHNALFKFEDVRIVRDMRNSVNRLVNCETANLNKTISASFRQVESIKLIDEVVGLDQLPKRLQSVAYARLRHQEASLNELAQNVQGEELSKSGVNHRLKKLDEIAEKIRQGEEIPI